MFDNIPTAAEQYLIGLDLADEQSAVAALSDADLCDIPSVQG